MTEPRRRYALPAPDGPMPALPPTLWVGTCQTCAGAGVIAVPIDLDDTAPLDSFTCPACNGTGIDPA